MLGAFTRHPRESGMGYWEHCAFALGVAFEAALVVVAACVHAVFPFWLQHSASERLLQLVARLPAAQREAALGTAQAEAR